MHARTRLLSTLSAICNSLSDSRYGTAHVRADADALSSDARLGITLRLLIFGYLTINTLTHVSFLQGENAQLSWLRTRIKLSIDRVHLLVADV